MGKLKFKIVYVSGEDRDYPASELNFHSPQTRGWQSPRFCVYPQEVIIQLLDGECHVKQTQVLSHQFKIATKIELFIGSGPVYSSAKWKRLGYMSLDSNERSNYKARELKSVYLDAEGNFMKFVVHKCYVNPENLYNQVGIIALNVIGTPLNRGSAPHEASPFGSGGNYLSDMALDMKTDPETANALREVFRAKADAAEKEDFDRAKLLKSIEDNLRNAAPQLARLALDKKEAVQREDYDTAKVIKHQIDRVRGDIAHAMAMAGVVVPGFAPPPGPAPGFPPSSGSMGFGRGPPPHMGMMPPGPMGMPPGSMPMSSGPMGGPPMPMGSGPMGPRGMLPPHGMNAGIPPHMQPPGPARGPPRGPPGGFGGPPGAMPGPDMGSPPRGPPGPRTVNVFAQHPPPPPQDSMDDDGPPQDYEEQPEAGPYGGGMSSPMASPAGHQGFAPTYEDSYQEESYGQPPPMQYSPQRPGSRHIRPADANYIERAIAADEKVRNAGGATGPVPIGVPDASIGGGGGGGGGETPDPSHAEGLRGVQGIEELPPPDPLPAAVATDSAHLIETFGEHIIKCLYSKPWQLREAALNKMCLDLEEFPGGKAAVAKSAMQLIAHICSKEKIPQVYLVSMDLLKDVVEKNSDEVPKPQWMGMLEPVLGGVVERLGDSNTRCREAARNTLIMLAASPTVTPPPVVDHLLRKPNKKQIKAPRPLTMRLQILLDLVTSYGLSKSSGLSADRIIQFGHTIEAFTHMNKEVRATARDLTVELMKIVGPKLESQLNLNEPQLKEIREAFEQAASSGVK